MGKQAAFTKRFAPSDADLAQCVRCGLCLQHCPTYVETGLEAESPRGRLYLIKAMAEGLIEPTVNVTGHMDMCLQCRNCEAVCPSGVPYGRIMEHGRAHVLHTGRAPFAWRMRALFLREVIAHPGRLSLLASALRLYRASGLRALAERTPHLRDRVALAPTIAGKEFKRRGVLARPKGALKYRVALLTGCIMPLAYGRVHAATVRVLARNGCEVVAPAMQACCGALHGHNGDLPAAMGLARREVDAFLAEDFDAVIVNSAGCGSAMKEYGQLLAEDGEYVDRARLLASRIRDVTEFLASLPFEPPRAPLDARVTYQDSCHLAHAQRITGAPREIIASIPGVRFVELPHGDRCCGSAGVYGLTQGEMSLRLLDEKMRDIRETCAEVIATANPGCMTQLEAGLRRHRMKGRVVHVVELLDEAYPRAAARV
ncbi:MAG: 4Fe-4S dicluster domain-containing protein [Chloroflexi bacterium]|nr:MAG: 4Fe-4S dicluster domain-containing protein [Chloroflexota bacterium]